MFGLQINQISKTAQNFIENFHTYIFKDLWGA